MNDQMKLTTEQELRKFESEKWWDFYQKAIGYAKDYGEATIQSLILINGGATVALLTFLSSMFSHDKMIAKTLASSLFYPFIFFSFGLLLAVIAGGIGYINFTLNAQALPGPNGLRKYIANGDITEWEPKKNLIKWTSLVAIGCVSGSVLVFAIGVFSSLQSFAKIN